MKFFAVAGLAMMLLDLVGCAAHRVKVQVFPDIPKDCETAADFGEEPYDLTKPCHLRSIGRAY